jgi:glycosyltransferase involved in cell wall biosynthesis
MAGVKVGFFGSFHPYLDRLSTTSIGLVHFLSKSDAVTRIVVFSPLGSELPDGMDRSKVFLCPVWRFDDPLSLIKAFMAVCLGRSNLDLLVFNVYLTSFGKRGLANGIGLLLPVAASFFFSTPPVVYMHNFIETQDVQSLGYRPSSGRAFVARTIERLIVARCDLVVPLVSQRKKLEVCFHRRLRSGIVPYAEAVPSLLQDEPGPGVDAAETQHALRILLFGSWGPQKDLEGIIRALIQLKGEGVTTEIIVAGGVNPNFPEYSTRLKSLVASSANQKMTLRLGLPESQVGLLFRGCDAIILPYNATGGYSAVMNVAAYYGIPILAYDLPELRECAEAIGTDCAFFRPGDLVALRLLLEQVSHGRAAGKFRVEAGAGHLQISVRAVEGLFGIAYTNGAPGLLGPPQTPARE